MLVSINISVFELVRVNLNPIGSPAQQCPVELNATTRKLKYVLPTQTVSGRLVTLILLGLPTCFVCPDQKEKRRSESQRQIDVHPQTGHNISHKKPTSRANEIINVNGRV